MILDSALKKMQSNIKVGVAGTGAQGQKHVRILSEMGALEAICDIPENKNLEQLGKKFKVRTTTEFADLLRSVDAVVIAAPTVLHHKLAKEAIASGRHLLIEKPVCSKLEQAYELRDMIAHAGLVCAVGHVERYNPAVQAAKAMLDKKEVGNLVALSARRVSPYPDRITDVGVILDLAIHDIAVVRFLARSEASAVYAWGGSFREQTKKLGIEDHAFINMQFENGTYSSIEASWLNPVRARSLAATCENGVVEVDYMNQTVRQIREVDRANAEAGVRFYSFRPEPLVNELRDFLESIRESREPLASLEDGIRALEIVEATKKSMSSGEKVEVQRK